jgi:CheY-like chemotaxis protein
MLIEDLCGRAAIAIENCLLYREIQDRDVRKDQFVAMLAHELRNPLGVISSALGILETVGGRDEPGTKARGAVRRQLKNLTQLIDDLVDVSRITTGKITMTRSPVNLKESVERCVEAFNAAGNSQAHRVQIQSRDTWIHADSVRIDQILTNLVENARKYTPPGGSIRIRVEPEDGDGVFEIEDTGAGMAPDVLAHAFDLFFQGERSPDRAEGGLGIGLTLVRQLVELHGGSIRAGSPGEGCGSRFTARFPRCAPPVSDAVPIGAREARNGRSRIVIVEDNDDARDMLKALLALEGHEVYEAPDGPSGVEMVETVDPEIAFIDLGLPGIDGYEVTRRLRAGRGKDVFLVALSGYGQSEDRRRAIEAGFNMHVVKPIDPDRLASVIRSLQERPLGELAKETLDGASG